MMNTISTNNNQSFKGAAITRLDRQFLPVIMTEYLKCSPIPSDFLVIGLEKSITESKKFVPNVSALLGKDVKIAEKIITRSKKFVPNASALLDKDVKITEKSISRSKKFVPNVLALWDKDAKIFDILMNKLYGIQFNILHKQASAKVTEIKVHMPNESQAELASNLASLIVESFNNKKTPIQNATTTKGVERFCKNSNNITGNKLTIDFANKILEKASKEPLTQEEINIINS